MTEIKNPKVKKTKGPIRTEAVVPFFIVAALTWTYFHFFFDRNLKSLLEYSGYQVLGSEVDITSLETSFWKASFRMQGVQITNSEKPTHNLIQIGDIRYSFLWDGLLRARFVVNEMAVEQIEFNVLRKSPGRVKPPEPPNSKSNEPSALEREANKLKDQALAKAQQDYANNVFGDIASMLGGTSGQDQLKNIENSLPSKAKLQAFESELKDKQTKWQEKIKTLPQGKEIQALGDRLGKVKTKDFKSPQELQESLQQLDSIFKEGDSKIKNVQSLNDDFNKDYKNLETNYKELDASIKKDISDLQARFKIPQLDASSLSRALFGQYLNPYLNQFNRYKALAEKYMPPKLLKKDKNGKDPDEIEIKPHPRAKGITYEFGRINSYPLFWIKRISVSSQAGTTPNAGQIKGLITDITSNQKLIRKPTVAVFEGQFPSLEIQGLRGEVSFDGTHEDSLVNFNFDVGSYALEGKDLIQSPDVQIAFKKAYGSLKGKGSLKALHDFQFQLNNQFQKIDYAVSAKDGTIQEVLRDVFKGIPVVTLEAHGKGELPSFPLEVQSNLGPELQKGFEQQLQKKINEAKVKLQAAIDSAIGKEKAKIDAQFSQLKAQVDGEIKKIQDQINGQKKQAEAKIDASKKDAENSGKKQLEKEGKKALDSLKEKLGF